MLTRVKSRFRFGAVLVAELRLMLKGQRWWWYIIAAGLAVASGAVVPREGRGILLAIAWVWPVLLWSSMGVRESRDQTSQILFQRHTHWRGSFQRFGWPDLRLRLSPEADLA